MIQPPSIDPSNHPTFISNTPTPPHSQPNSILTAAIPPTNTGRWAGAGVRGPLLLLLLLLLLLVVVVVVLRQEGMPC